MSQSRPRIWVPIQPLTTNWKDLEDPGIATLAKVWSEQVAELRDKEIFKTFVTKLRREWAIETGVLERLYVINDSNTKTLIEHGLDASVLVSSDKDKPSEQIMAMIRDQEAAINSMYQFIAAGRTLSIGYIQELHNVLTANQPTREAVDPNGNVITAPLLHGKWRDTHAWIDHEDGERFYYCEPPLLQPQMLDLVSESQRQMTESIPPEIRAAWLHHGFTLIHPFQDGNGRVARCLATLVMLRANWFPLVVTRNDKPKYIASLRAADGGDLKPLVQHFIELQKRAIRKALSLSESVIAENESVRNALAAASKRLGDRAKTLAQSQRKVFQVAEVLRSKVAEGLRSIVADTDKMLKSHKLQYKAIFDDAAHGSPRDYYYKTQIIQCANAHDYYANFPEYCAWALAAFVTDDRAEILFSFHGIGRDAKGVLCCSAIYCQKDRDGAIVAVESLSESPFEFTYRDDPFEVSNRFALWMDEAISTGVKKWSATL